MSVGNKNSGEYVTAGTGFADASDLRYRVVTGSPRWYGVEHRPTELPLSDPLAKDVRQRLEHEKNKKDALNNKISLLPEKQKTNNLQNDLSPTPTPTPSSSPQSAPTNANALNKIEQEKKLKTLQKTIQADNHSVKSKKISASQLGNADNYESVENKLNQFREAFRAGGYANIRTMGASTNRGWGARFDRWAKHWGLSETSPLVRHRHRDMEASVEHDAQEHKFEEKHKAEEYNFEEKQQEIRAKFQELSNEHRVQAQEQAQAQETHYNSPSPFEIIPRMGG